MAKRKQKAWVPDSTEPMRFIKILNIEFYDPEKSSKVYDINVLQEIDTGEIFLTIYTKGSKVLLSCVLLDKNIGISTLHHAIRHNLRAWIAQKKNIFEIKHIGNADFEFPKIENYEEIDVKDEELKIRNVSKKDRVSHTNDTADIPEEKPKRKRARKKDISKPTPKDNSEKTTVATRRDITNPKQKVSVKGGSKRKPKTTAKKATPKKKKEPAKKKTTSTNKKKTTANKKKTNSKSKSLF